MFYLAHISDIHLTPIPKISWRQLLNKRLTGYLNLIYNRKNCFDRSFLDRVLHSLMQKQVDCLAISGDLVNIATIDEFKNVKIWLDHIEKKLPISICPGNHDVYVRGAFKQITNIFSPWMKSDIELGSIFPTVNIYKNIAIINVNSAVPMPPFFAMGYFGRKQAKLLGMILKQCAEKNLFRVINIHHPPIKGAVAWPKGLIGIGRFQEVLAKHGAELVVHGHSHQDSLHYTQNVPVVGVGSASKPCNHASNYNLFAIEKAQAGWHCILNRFGVDAKGQIIKKETIKL